MSKQIDIPGVGVVEFPDSMSDEQITQSIQKNIIPKYSAQNESLAQTFGRSSASLADSALNALTGTLDVAAYPLARAYYGMTGNRTPEQAAAMAQQETTSPKDLVGRAFGVTGTPGYENAPIRKLGTAVGETINEGAIKPIAQATGLPEQDVGSLANLATMAAGPAIPKVARAVGSGVKATAGAAGDVAGGALGRATGYIAAPGETPRPWQSASSRVQLQDTYIPDAGLKMLKQNPGMTVDQLPKELGPQPTSNLPKGPLAITGGHVPVAGQAWRATGEQLGETYRNPLTAALDIGSAIGTGVPLVSSYKGLSAGAKAVANKILSKQGFSALTPEQVAILDKGKNPFGNGPMSPTGPAVPATPAQTNAQSMGITPPMTAEQSGFTNELGNLARGPAVPNNMNMMTRSSAQIPEAYHSKQLTEAMLKGNGSWKIGDKTFNYITTPDGSKRLQVKDPTGMVIDERYLK
jgi:hypothetical protein